ncbi:hypothetical protein MPER_14847, partial [Moniliophthora perniciosa FA553]
MKIERVKRMDGPGEVDLRTAGSIYFVETRARVQNVVVLMNLQLYMVDSTNYLVDFHHKKTCRASTELGAGKFDIMPPTNNHDHAHNQSVGSNSNSAPESPVFVPSEGPPIYENGIHVNGKENGKNKDHGGNNEKEDE